MKKDDIASAPKDLSFANDFRPWSNAAQEFLAGKRPVVCPLCQKSTLEATAVCGADRVGYLLFTCPSCGKSFNFSRIRFPPSVETDKF